MKEDNSHSWVRISFGTIRYVNNYVKYNTQSLASPQEEEAETSKLRSDCQPDQRQKRSLNQENLLAPRPFHLMKEFGLILYHRGKITIHTSCRKRVINILRNDRDVNRERDGAIQFYKIKFLMRDHSLSTQNWSDNRWLACLAAGGGPKRRYQYCPDYLGSIIYLPGSSRTFWGQHHWSGNAGSCVNYTWNIFLRLPCGKQFQYSFNSQQWFDTWWSRIKRKTICVLLAYWPKGRELSRSRKYWLFCAASCSIHAKLVEKAPGYSILDWY